ncbi:MAG: hypothetical protein VB087_08005 [Candidatus Limiplasma sp.]|nr:hypothetical protein [Candidatus Limiplasma sp.]MEA5144907.1 hypothetical protein [Candidatus Limiplasma sp.]
MTAQDIINVIRNDNGQQYGYWYGLRCCKDSAAVGETLPVSVDWLASNADEDLDYSKPEYLLDGSSAVSLGDWLYCTEELAVSDIEKRVEIVNNYPGRNVYLVRGVCIAYGSDDYEVILSANGGGHGAEVVAVL